MRATLKVPAIVGGDRRRLAVVLPGSALADADPGHRNSFLDHVPENAWTLALTRAWLGEPDAEESHQ